MVDIANLAITVDTTDLAGAGGELDQFAAKGREVQGATTGAAASTSRLTAEVDRMMGPLNAIAAKMDSVDGMLAKMASGTKAAAAANTGTTETFEAMNGALKRVAEAMQRAEQAHQKLKTQTASHTQQMLQQAQALDALQKKYDALAASQNKQSGTPQPTTPPNPAGSPTNQPPPATTPPPAAPASAPGKTKAQQELEALTRTLDPLAASQARVTQAEKVLQTALAAGVPVTQRQKDMVDQLRKSHQELEARVANVGKTTKATTMQLSQMTPQLNDIFTSITGGMPPFLILTQQGPQITQIFGGVANTFKTLAATLGPVKIGFGLAAIAIAGFIIAAESQERMLNGLENRLMGTRSNYEALAKSIDTVARAAAQSSDIGTGEAREVLQTVVSVRGLDSSQEAMRGYLDTIRGLSAAMGEDLPAAANRFATAMKEPTEAAKKYAAEGLAGFNAGMVRQIELLELSGEKTQAQKLVAEALTSATGRAATNQTELQKATAALGQAFSRVYEVLRPLVEAIGTGLVTALSTVVSWIASAVDLFGRFLAGARDVLKLGEGNRPGAGVQQDGRVLQSVALDPKIAISGEVRSVIERTAAEMGRANLGPIALRVSQLESDSQHFYPRTTIPKLGDEVNGERAVGLMQVLPSTARGLGIGNIEDQGQNVKASLTLLAQLSDRFNGDAGRIIAAYHMGAQGLQDFLDGKRQMGPNTRQYVERAGFTPEQIRAGRPLYTVERNEAAEASMTRNGSVVSQYATGTMGYKRENLQAEITRIEAALASARELASKGMDTGLGAGGETALLERLRTLRAELVATVDPLQELERGWRTQAAAQQQLDPVSRELAARYQQIDEAVRNGADPELAQAARATALISLMGEKAAAFRTVQQATERSTDQNTRLAQAYGQSTAAGRQMEAQIKAENELRGVFIQGSPAEIAAIELRTKAIELDTLAQGKANVAKSVVQQEEQLEALQTEISLVGESAQVREVELAVMKARQDMIRQGIPLGEKEAEAYVANARKMAEGNQQLDLMRQSATGLKNLFSDAFSSIGDAISDAFATGSMKALDFGNIAKAVLSKVASYAAQMALVNPLSNMFMGSNLPTLTSTVAAFSGAGAVGGAAGGAGGGGGGLGGLSGLMNLGGVASSISDALGLGSISSLLGLGGGGGGGGLLGGLTGGISSILGTSLWGGGAGLATATTTALQGMGFATGTLGTIPTAIYGPATPAAVAAAGGTAATSLGSLLGGAGAGFGLGTLLNSLVGGKSMGGMIGSGGGALAGAAIGSIVPGVGTLIGGLIGGAGGGLLGGLFGPGKPNPAASLTYGVDGSGGLAVTGSRSKHMETDELEAQMTEALGKINTAIASLGLTLDKGTNGITLYGNDARPEEDKRNMTTAILDGLRGGSEAMRQVIQAELSKANSGDDNLERALANVEWVKNVYDPLVKTQPVVSELQQTLNGLQQQFEGAITRAGELGLSTDELSRKFAEAVEAQKNVVRASFDTQMRQLDGRGYLDQVMAVRSSYSASESSYRDAGINNPIELFNKQMKSVLDTFSADQLREVERSFAGIDDAAVELARQLLATGSAAQKAIDAQNEAIKKATTSGYWQASRSTEGRDYVTSVEGVRSFYEENRAAMEAAGVDGVKLFHQQMTAVLDQLNVDQLRDVAVSFRGLDDAAADAAEQMLKLGNSATRAAKAAEEAATRQYGGNIRAFLDRMNGTTSAGASPGDALKASRAQYERDLKLAQGGDKDALGRITSTADQFLQAGRGMYASGDEYQSIRDYVQKTLAALPATQSYDALILAELQKLGGTVKVSVDIEMVRAITEVLNALPQSELDKLQKNETIIRKVSEAMGSKLTAAQIASLVESEEILRSVEQKLGRNLTDAERASLVDDGTVTLSIIQKMGRNLTDAEWASLVQGATIVRTVQQSMGRNLTAEERASLVAGGSVLIAIQQSIGRNLTAAERASLVDGATVIRTIQQAIGRNLTDAERASLVQAGVVIRTVQQALGRDLSADERAALVKGETVTRRIEQAIARNLTDAERSGLLSSAIVQREVEEKLGRRLTVAELAALQAGGTVARTVEEKLGLTLTAAQRESLQSAATIQRLVEEKLGRKLTETEIAGLAQSATVLRVVEQQLGRKLTAEETRTLVASETILRTIEQQLGRKLTTKEWDTIIGSESVMRTIEQKLGRQLTEAELTSLIKSEGVIRTIEEKLGRKLTDAELVSLVQAESVVRTVSETLGRQLTTAEAASLYKTAEIKQTIEQALGKSLTTAELAKIVEGGTIKRTIESYIGRALTKEELAGIKGAGTFLRTVEQTLGRTLTEAEVKSILEGGTFIRDVKQSVETTETVQISRSIDDKIGKQLEKQTAILGEMKASNATSAAMLYVQDNRLRNIDMWTYGLRELARGQWGGIRVTTPKASGSANDEGNFGAGSNIGNWGTTLSINAKGNAFGGMGVEAIGDGDNPGVVSRASLMATRGNGLAILGEAGSEGILPLERMSDGELGVNAVLPDREMRPQAIYVEGGNDGGDVAELREEVVELRKQVGDLLKGQQALLARIASLLGDIADTSEDTAKTNRKMANADRSVVGAR